jgi:hypothetical protein
VDIAEGKRVECEMSLWAKLAEGEGEFLCGWFIRRALEGERLKICMDAVKHARVTEQEGRAMLFQRERLGIGVQKRVRNALGWRNCMEKELACIEGVEEALKAKEDEGVANKREGLCVAVEKGGVRARGVADNAALRA